MQFVLVFFLISFYVWFVRSKKNPKMPELAVRKFGKKLVISGFLIFFLFLVSFGVVIYLIFIKDLELVSG